MHKYSNHLAVRSDSVQHILPEELELLPHPRTGPMKTLHEYPVESKRLRRKDMGKHKTVLHIAARKNTQNVQTTSTVAFQ